MALGLMLQESQEQREEDATEVLAATDSIQRAVQKCKFNSEMLYCVFL